MKEEGAVLIVPDVLENVVIRENLRVTEFSSLKASKLTVLIINL